VCGIEQLQGHYCDNFGGYTIRSTKTGTKENTTLEDFAWWDTFEDNLYGDLVVANEFIWYDRGLKSWTVPYDGTWCMAMYQDGHHLSEVEVGWRQSWGYATVDEWRLWKLLTWCCLLEFVVLVWLYLKGQMLVMRLGVMILMYHISMRVAISMKNLEMSGVQIFLMTLVSFFVEIGVFQALMNTVKVPMKRSFLHVLIMRSIVGVIDHWLFQAIHLCLTMLVLYQLWKSHQLDSNFTHIRTSLLFLLLGLFMTQSLIVLTETMIKMLTTPMREKSLWQKFQIISQETQAHGSWGLIHVIDSTIWSIVLLYLTVMT
jgi:hypothetical protein